MRGGLMPVNSPHLVLCDFRPATQPEHAQNTPSCAGAVADPVFMAAAHVDLGLLCLMWC